MDGDSKGPAAEKVNFSFKNIGKSTTFRVLVPMVISLQVGWWYFFRNRTVFDEERRIFVLKDQSDN